MPQKKSLFQVLMVILLLVPAAIMAQVKNPVKWTYSAKKLATGKYELHMTATVEKGWHIYSQKTPEGGPVPTAFTFTKNPLVTLSGSVNEVGKLETHFEKLFDVDVKQYSDKVDFVQVATTKGTVKTNVIGKVEYMLCNDRECLPPKELNFSIALQ
jgi:DsbC/DsbD-like thiol-disulfide interchange protein